MLVVGLAAGAVQNAHAQSASLVLSETALLEITEGSSASYTVKLATQPNADVTVSIGGTSGTDLTLNKTSLTFTMSNYDDAQTVNVSATRDDDARNDDATLTHTASGGGYDMVSADLPVTVTDTTRMRLIAVVENVPEGESRAIRAMLPMPLDEEVTISVTVTPNGGRADEYELSINTTLTIAAGTTESTGEVIFTSLDDFMNTGNRGFNATLTADHARVDPDTEFFQVLDDDHTITGMQLAPSRIFENGGEAKLIAFKHRLHEGVVKMTVSLEPSDRARLSGTTLTFEPGALYATETLTITAVDNTADEPDQTVTISATVTEGRGVRTPRPLQLTIVDDEDMMPELALVLTPPRVREGLVSTVTAVASAPLTEAATITVSAAPGHAQTRTDDYELSASTMLTIPAGGTRSTGTVTITPIDDSTSAGRRSRVVTVSGTVTGGGVADPADQTLTILEDDSQVAIDLMATPGTIREGETSTITLRARQPVPEDVSVTVSETSAAAELSADPVLVIPAGATESTGVVTLTALDDADMRNASVSLRGTASSGSAFVNLTTVFILDDDEDRTYVMVSPVPTRVLEGGTSTIVANLTQPVSDDVTLTIGVNTAHEHHTATAADYTMSDNRTLTIPAGSTSSTGLVTVTASNDEYYGPGPQRTVSIDVQSVSGIDGSQVNVQSALYILEDEAVPQVTIELSPASIPENGGQSRVTAKLNTIVDAVVEVTVTTAPTGIAEPGDYTQTGTRLTIPAGQKTSTGTVTISAADDGIAGPDKHLIVTATVVVVGMEESGLIWHPWTEGLTILDDDVASTGIALSVLPSSVPEDGGSRTVTVTAALDEGARAGETPVTVAVGAAGDAAEEGTDYQTVADLAMAIAEGNTADTATFTLVPTDDAVAEGDETLSVSGSTTVAGLAVTATEVTITDDDVASTGIALSVLPSSVPEDGGSRTVTVTAALDGSARVGETPVTVAVGAAGDAAEEGTDYQTVADLAMAIAEGNTADTATFTLVPTDDAVAEGDETLSVSGSTTVAGLAVTATEVTITDDDGSAAVTVADATAAEGDTLTFTVTLDKAVQGGLTVTPSFTDVSATSGTDYTENTAALTFAGTASETQTFKVATTEDALVEGDETFTVGLTVSGTTLSVTATDTGTGTITDDDGSAAVTVGDASAAEGDALTFTVTLDKAVQGGLTVTPSFTDVTATKGTDYTENTAALTFAGTAGETETFKVATTEDALVEGDETFTVGLTVSGTTLSVTATDTGTGTINDDDTTPTAITLSLNPSSVSEGADATDITVTASLNGSARTTATTVSVTRTGGTATSGTDYPAISAFDVTIAAGNTSETATLSFDPTEDNLAEGDETVILTGAASGLTSGTATLTITDNDTAPTAITLSLNPSSVSEGAAATDITVTASLNGSARTTATTVSVTRTGGTATSGTDYPAISAFDVTIAAGNTSGTATLSFDPTEDNLAEGDETVVLTAAATGLTSGTATLTITDNDTRPTVTVSLLVSPNPVDEGQPVTVTARLSGTLASGVTIPLVLAAGTAESDDFGSLASIIISGGQTTGTGTISTTNDADRDDETFTVSLGALPDGLPPGSPSSVVVTIRDRTAPPNRPPAVSVSCAPCVVAPGGSVGLTATASDPDGDPLTYAWSATWGGFDGPVDEPAAIWTAPAEPGRATVRVHVSDGRGFASAEVEVHAVNGRPEFGRSSYRFELPENLDGRTRPVELGAVVAEDPDGDDLKYGIVFGDSDRFTVGLRDGVVRYVGSGEDYETEPNIFELTVRVRDNFGADDATRVVVEVTDENELPEVTATCDPCVVPRGGVIRLEAAATDPDGDALTYAWSAPRGRFSDAGEPVSRWTAPDALGTTAIRVEVSDGRGGSTSAVVEVEVFNRSPAFGQPVYEFELPENVDGRESPAVLGRVAAEDPDGDALTYELAAGDGDRFAVGARDGAVTYIGPGEDFEAEPNLFGLAVRVRDGFGEGDEARVVVVVTDVNEPPKVTASCDPCAVPRGGEVRLEARATDPDGDALTYGWSAPRGRFFDADQAAAVWTAPDALGTTAIRVEVSDGRGGRASAIVTVDVFNRSPAFEQPSYGFTLPENLDGRTRPVELGGVAALDPDGDALTYELAAGDGDRFAVGARDGVVRYIGSGEDFETPPNRFELAVRALDGFGGEARAEVAIEVTDVNEAPEAMDDRAVTPEDRAVTVDVLANDTDPEGDHLHVRSITAAAHGAVRLVSGGIVIYAPDADFHGADSFTYVASDGRGLRDTATVDVTVLPVNDAPTPVGRVPDQTLDEGGAPVRVDLSPYFGDVDGDALAYGARSNDTGVVLSEVAGAVLTLTPVVYGSATVTVTAWDPAGLSAAQSVQVGVSDRRQRAVLGNVLAATARGHLASVRAALGRRMQADPCEASRLDVMGRSVPLGRTEAETMLGRIGTRARSSAAAALRLGKNALDPFAPIGLQEGQGAPATLAARSVPETAERMEAALRSIPETAERMKAALLSVPARALDIGGGGSGEGAADFLLGWGGSQQDGGRCPSRGRWSLWGQGDIQSFKGTPSLDSGYDGELSTAYVGLDTRLTDRWLAGVAVSRSKGVGDWRAGASDGRLTQFMTAVHPYLRWDGRSTSIWASAGAGRGNARNVRADGRTGASPTDLRLGLVELEQRVGAPGGLDFAFLGDAAWARLRTGAGKETVDGQDIAVNQVRIGLDLSVPARIGGLQLTPSGTVHARRDGGAGQTGDGIEVAGGLRAVLGFVRLDAQARMLTHHTAEGYGERGAAVTLALAKRGDGQGFSLSVSPRWGARARATGALLDGPLGGRSLRPGKRDPDRWTLDARAGYGVKLPGGLRLDVHGYYGSTSAPSLGLSVGIQEVQGERRASLPGHNR